jgi:hypothetical protein
VKQRRKNRIKPFRFAPSTSDRRFPIVPSSSLLVGLQQELEELLQPRLALVPLERVQVRLERVQVRPEQVRPEVLRMAMPRERGP